MTLDVTDASTSRTQTITRVKLKQLLSGLIYSRDTDYIIPLDVLIIRTQPLRVSQALILTSVSRDAAAVLRWSGMSSWVWEWIPAGWSCHSGWRHSEQNVREL